MVALASVAAVFVLAIRRAPLWLWGSACAAAVVSANPQLLSGEAVAYWWWLPLAPCLFSVGAIRRRLITRRLQLVFKRATDSISATERQALAAGTVGWDAELFGGRPDFMKLLRLPRPRLRPREKKFIAQKVSKLCEMCDEWQIRRGRDLPPSVWRYLRKGGFFGLIIPKDYGGKKFSPEAQSQIISLLCSKSLTAAVTVMVPNSLGPGELLMRYGAPEQKRRYLPRLAKGLDIPCFALTGPHSGSDAAGMPDVGVVCVRPYRGRPVLGIEVTWRKRYITLAPVATLLGLAFYVEDPKGLLGRGRDLGITLALIPTDHKGVEIGKRHDPAGGSFQNGPTTGNKVFVPMDWVIGGAERVGSGWLMLMECLAAGRALSLPALATAGAKSLLRICSAYGRIRRQFGIPLGKMEGIGERLAEIAGHAYTLEAARSLTCAILGRGERPAVLSALFKYQSTERMRKCINHAMDIHGGKGICDGAANYLLESYRMTPVAITVEGANILSRSLIVFGQGGLRCHPHLKAEMDALKAPPSRQLKLLDEAFCRHIRFSLSNIFAAFWHNLSGGRLLGAPRGFRLLALESLNFSLLADVTLCLLGARLKRKQAISGRFADAFSELYMLSALLKRHIDDGSPPGDRDILRWSMAKCLFTYQNNMRDILANYPVKSVGRLLRVLVFPLGLRHHPPEDALMRKIAAQSQLPGPRRRRWTKGTYVPVDEDSQLALLEKGITMAGRVEKSLSALNKFAGSSGGFRYNRELLRRAVRQKALSPSRAKLLRRYQKIVEKVIAVDEFPPSALAKGR